ncbi:MAG TPA: radical SAM/SPASM domain-containing protein [Candidatus Tripitaka californicus]|uniref:radical SAM/SPASM domain-containing protein n=1 Tax=Candidatus Tripitaka californicus TaxID=3367616 RepID=UPI00402906F7
MRVEALRDIAGLSRALSTARFLGRPFILSHLITRRCNADCPFCLWKGEGVELDSGQVKNLYAQAGRSGFLSVVIWGGEPLLREDLGEVLFSAREAGLKTTIITNGYNLPERVGEIGPYLDTLLVSFDAPNEFHDTMRRLPGCFRRAVDGIRSIRADFAGVRPIIISVITRENLQEVEGLLGFSRKEGLPIIFQAINTLDYAVSPRPIDPDAVPSQEGQSSAFKLIRHAKNRVFPVLNSYEYLNTFIKTCETSLRPEALVGGWGQSPNPIAQALRRLGMYATFNANGHYRCHYKKLVFRVDTNGDVIDCTRPGRVMANVREKGLREIIGGAGYKDFIRRAESCALCADAGTLESSYLWELHPRPLFDALRFLARS